MISKKEILKMVHRVRRQTHGHSTQKAMHPEREWLIGIGLFLLIVVVGGAFNLKDHAHYRSLEDQVVRSVKSVDTYDAELAREVINRYTTRSEAFEKLAGAVPEKLPEIEIPKDTESDESEMPEPETGSEARTTSDLIVE